jgi:hypothetical protein
MLFNLTTHASFPCKYPTFAIRCGEDKGPNFGNDELSAYYEPFNRDYACRSVTNDEGYNIPVNNR